MIHPFLRCAYQVSRNTVSSFSPGLTFHALRCLLCLRLFVVHTVFCLRCVSGHNNLPVRFISVCCCCSSPYRGSLLLIMRLVCVLCILTLKPLCFRCFLSSVFAIRFILVIYYPSRPYRASLLLITCLACVVCTYFKP